MKKTNYTLYDTGQIIAEITWAFYGAQKIIILKIIQLV